MLLRFLDVESNTMMVVLWNPSIRKSVIIVIPNVLPYLDGYAAIGFGVCPDNNSDPKLVRLVSIKLKYLIHG